MSYIVRKSVQINADPRRVWDALTSPELTKKYFFGCRVYSDWEVGSDIIFKGRMFWIIKIELKGKILAIEPGKLLKYSLANASDEGRSSSVVTDTLSYKDGVTTVSVADDVGQGEGAQKRFQKSEKGWDKVLKGLKKTVEPG